MEVVLGENRVSSNVNEKDCLVKVVDLETAVVEEVFRTRFVSMYNFDICLSTYHSCHPTRR